MKMTEIQISLTVDESKDRDGVLAFVRLVFDNELAIRDIKVMSRDGFIWLGMPARKVAEVCASARCKRRVPVMDKYCGQCGTKQPPRVVEKGRGFVDVAHPITPDFREYLEQQITVQYNAMISDAKQHLKVKSKEHGGQQSVRD